MVVSPHHLATAAGARILAKGGSAIDASIAVSSVLAVVYPHMTGIGGDAFWLLYDRQDNQVRAYNGSGRSGAEASLDAFDGMASIPKRGILSAITVPGMIDTWYAVHKEYGRLPMADILEAAISYAEHGFPLSRNQIEHTVTEYELLAQTPYTSDIYLPSGKLPNPGESFVQTHLAATLKEIAREGRDAFYKGRIAGEIAAFLGEAKGLLTKDDFAGHHGNWVAPISSTYKGYEVYQMPPNSQGFSGLMALNILEPFDLGQRVIHGSFEYYHLQIEALKLSFRDRNRFLTDPEHASVPLERLLSKTYGSKLASSIRMDQVCSIESEPKGNDTAYAAVIDEEGNAVSFIQSLFYAFGSGVTAGETGIMLQNRGSYFSLDPGHVNVLKPNKRTFSTLMPAMACLQGKPSILYGTQGGEGQPQTQTAIFTRMVDYQMDPQQAINEPRFVWGTNWGDTPKQLKVESRIDPGVVDALMHAGHSVHTVKAYDGAMGQAQAIRIDENRLIKGGFDPRSDGSAIGW
ncbi:gamma-glutamyltransferase [Paenibacillus agricola]|uniref:Glutathione hydrolase proenzyme n=1 Tax=Paenibacillus agricola TaxID=2716264 RepID=A0ABX0JA80_9BACL|nr:gamma-glutamyltransferase [Paenibacillus agricola]NHN32843.1 gamma-glutamyltransferase [Paenibacillus agricola]